MKLNKYLKLFGITLLTLLMVPSCNEKTATSFVPPETKINYNLYLYVSGSTLEANIGAFSKNLNEMLNSTGIDNIKIYGLVGGSKQHQNPSFKAGETTLFETNDNKIEVIKQKPMNMGSVDTFKEFMDVYNETKNIHNALIFWGHGSPYGICNDSNYNNDALTYKELNEGLGTTYFDYMIFNSCLTSNLDLMSFISNNASYAIASEDAFPSTGYDYDSLVKIFAEPSLNLENKGKAIINSTIKKYENSDIKDYLTLSLINLKDLSSYLPIYLDYFEQLYIDINSFYKSARNAVSVNEYGKDLNDLFEEHIHIYDMSKFNPVVYTSNGSYVGYNGIYLYYLERLSKDEGAMYKSNSFFDNYFTLLNERKNYQNDNYITFKPSSSINDSIYSIKIINHQFYAFATYIIEDLNNNFIKEDVIGLNKIYLNQELQFDVSKNALYKYKLNDLDINPKIYCVQDVKDTLISIYEVKVKLNGVEGDLIFQNVLDKSNNKIETSITGFRYNDNDNMNIYFNKIKNGDVISIDDNETTFNDSNIEMIKIDEAKISILVEDIYGKTYPSTSKIYKNK